MANSVIIAIIACITAIIITLILCHYAVKDDELETRYIEAMRDIRKLQRELDDLTAEEL